MIYELFIQKNNEWTVLDIGSGDIPMAFQINSLTELKDINASYSQTLKLPRSKINSSTFDYADDFTSQSDFPYRIYLCVVYCNGAQITPPGYRLELRSVTKLHFECQITSNAKGLFTSLQALTMSDLGFGNIPYTIEEIQASLNNEREYKFMLSAIHSRRAGDYELFGYVRYDEHAQYGQTLVSSITPYFRLRRLVELMLAAQGYTLETDVALIPGYTEAWLSLAKFKPGPFTDLEGTVTGRIEATGDQTMPKFYFTMDTAPASNTFKYKEIDRMSMSDTITEGLRTSGIVYTATDYVRVNFKFKTSASDTSLTFRVRYRLRKFGIPLSNTQSSFTQAELDEFEQDILEDSELLSRTDLADLDNGEWVSDTVVLAPGEKVYIEALLEYSSNLGKPTWTTITASFGDDNKALAGATIDVGNSFEFKNQMECFKLWVQLYGLTVYVDENAKVVRAMPFKTLLDRIAEGNTVDWSDKLVVGSERTTTFRMDSYAQVNRILLGNNDILGLQEESLLYVDNDTLDATKDLLTLTATSSDNIHLKNPLRPIYQDGTNPAWENDYDIDPRYYTDEFEGVSYQKWSQAEAGTVSGSIPFWKYRDSKTHIVKEVEIGYTVYRPPIGYLPLKNDPVARYLSPNPRLVQHIPLSHFIGTYYDVLQNNILNMVRVVEAEFYLTTYDIQMLDLFRPVYIGYFGQYFYINKINNYQAGKLTKITLVCLNLE